MPADPANDPLVLIADDNPQILELLEAYLDPLPLRTLTAPDGDAALACVRDQQPDLILLDIMMPRHSGYEVCRALKADPATRAIPVLMVTALNEVGDLERARECSADEFITKPVNKIELLELVRKYVDLPDA